MTDWKPGSYFVKRLSTDYIESTRYLDDGQQTGEQCSNRGRTKTTKAFVRQIISLERKYRPMR